ncbi:ABC transporter ATP-binding protein [Streptomyces sp. NPDC127068]|uniref:ABC transporter ATP-binding protein n=1 Tax=Streptomyces sp. NPDC127068 TaxID=3347127 RepID=UPI003666186B
METISDTGRPPAIEIRNLTRRYGGRAVVNDVSFSVVPGKVTGFLGPNGAGKSTTMRLLLGLERPDLGTALINGRPYADLERPMFEVGAMLEAKSFHKGRSARNHLRALAQSHDLPDERVDEVIATVGLGSAAGRRAGGFSLGMAQRLGIAVALLGDPDILVLDEPVNGLDPEGILWIRNLMKSLAAEGRTVLVSSHLMNEMAVTAEHLLVIGKGRLLADCSTLEFIESHTDPEVYAATPAVARPGMLEEAFMRLTSSSAEYTAT